MEFGVGDAANPVMINVDRGADEVAECKQFLPQLNIHALKFQGTLNGPVMFNFPYLGKWSLGYLINPSIYGDSRGGLKQMTDSLYKKGKDTCCKI